MGFELTTDRLRVSHSTYCPMLSLYTFKEAKWIAMYRYGSICWEMTTTTRRLVNITKPDAMHSEAKLTLLNLMRCIQKPS